MKETQEGRRGVRTRSLASPGGGGRRARGSRGECARGLFLALLVCGTLGLTACRQVIVERVIVPEKVEPKASYADVISNISPSVVSVFTRTVLKGKPGEALTNEPALEEFLQKGKHSAEDTPHAVVGLGSGIVVNSNGYILTSAHVVDGADEIKVTTSNGDELTAKVVGADPPTDVAVLRVSAKNLPAAKLADSSQVRVGDVVFAIGDPFGVGQTVTSGIVSGLERSGFGITDYEDFIQTDAPINPGNSGGALVNAQGRVVGINSAILTRGGGSEGIGLAVPSNMARDAMEQIIAHGRVIRGFLGVSLVSLPPELAEAASVPRKQGALILSVVPDSPAARAGLREGDIVLQADGKTVENSRDLRLRIAQAKPGSSFKLRVLHLGKRQDLAATLSEAPRPKVDPEHPDSIKEPVKKKAAGMGGSIGVME